VLTKREPLRSAAIVATSAKLTPAFAQDKPEWPGLLEAKDIAEEGLPLEHKAEILVGMKQGDDKVDKWLAGGNKVINGWNVGSFFGDEAFFDGDWLMRAGAAKGGLYGNDAVEAMYPYTRTDATGATLDGAKHAYTLTFAPGQLPPVNAFWSVTMYDGKSQLLVENPIKRYLINSPMLPGMKTDADGSLTLYIQKDSPGADKEANWLPAPADTIYLVMRLYWPKTEAPSILPAGVGTWQPPGVRQVSEERVVALPPLRGVADVGKSCRLPSAVCRLPKGGSHL
jgi:hypothetical protein